MTDEELRDQGWTDGNFDAAYATECLEEEDDLLPSDKAERQGYLLGFFSSYTDDELPSDWEDEVLKLRRRFPDLA